MKKQYLNPKEMSTPRFYTHAVTAEGTGKLVYVSGQVSWDAGGNVVGKGDMRAHEGLRRLAQRDDAEAKRQAQPDISFPKAYFFDGETHQSIANTPLALKMSRMRPA